MKLTIASLHFARISTLLTSFGKFKLNYEMDEDVICKLEPIETKCISHHENNFLEKKKKFTGFSNFLDSGVS
jgi:hypothetical protein